MDHPDRPAEYRRRHHPGIPLAYVALFDPLIRTLRLSEQEKQDLVALMQSLTGSNVDTLVSDAFAAPVGDLKKGDPSWVHGTDVEVH